MPRPSTVLFSVFSIFLALNAQAATEVRGRVFYEKLSAKEPSFFFHSLDETKNGKRLVVTTYTDKDGNELVREENSFEDGKLLRSVYKQNQVSERGSVSFKDGKALFSFTDEDGTETDSEEIVPNMILGSMIGDHIFAHWDELMKGDSVHVRYMAIERLETVGFKFFKNKERVVQGEAVVDFTMKPSSFIIAAIVEPIRITMTRDEPRRLVEVGGRTPIRWSRNQPAKGRKDWKAIDARIEMDPPKELLPEAPVPATVEPPPSSSKAPAKKR